MYFRSQNVDRVYKCFDPSTDVISVQVFSVSLVFCVLCILSCHKTCSRYKALNMNQKVNCSNILSPFYSLYRITSKTWEVFINVDMMQQSHSVVDFQLSTFSVLYHVTKRENFFANINMVQYADSMSKLTQVSQSFVSFVPYHIKKRGQCL